MKKTIAVMCLAGIVAFFLLRQKERKGPTVDVPSAESAAVQGTKPLTLGLSHIKQGSAWRTRVAGQVQSNGKWIDNCTFAIRYDVVEANPRNGARVAVTFEDCTSKLSDTPFAGALNMMRRQFDCHVDPSGRVRSLGVNNGRPFGADDLRYYVWACDMACLGSLFSPKALVPGDEWSDRNQTSLPGYPDSVFITDSKNRFAGYAIRDGIDVAVIHTVRKFHLEGNIPLQTRKTASQVAVTTLVYADLVVEGDQYLNLQSRLPIAREDSGAETKLKARITSYVKGRQVPVQEVVVKDTPTAFRHVSEIEYLQ